MPLLYSTLPRSVSRFLPRSKSLNFTATVSTHRDFEAQENKICHCFCFFPFYLTMGPDALVLALWMLSLKQNFSPSLSYFTFIKRFFISSLISAISMVLHAHLRWLIFLLATLNTAWVSSSPAFHMMYPAYKLNKQGDNI